jgi:molecular chaperone DnaK
VAEKTAFGIDLGTTMSVVAQVSGAGVPVVLPNAEGSPTTPSIVLFDSGHAIVGAVARESLATEPESVVQLVKRHIGSGWTFDYSGVSYRPEHVSALILRKLVQDAQLLAGPITQAAITVPTSATRCARRPCAPGNWPGLTCSACCPSRPPPRSPTATTGARPARRAW